MNQKTLQDTFCERQDCTAAQFENQIFWRCLYPHAVPLAWVLKKLNPSFFMDDRTLIQQLGFDRDLDEVDANLRDFQYVNNARRHWLRTGLKIRVSGRRVASLARKLFADQPPQG